MHGSAAEFSRLSLRAVCQRPLEYFLENWTRLGIGSGECGERDGFGSEVPTSGKLHPFIEDPYLGMSSLLGHEKARYVGEMSDRN